MRPGTIVFTYILARLVRLSKTPNASLSLHNFWLKRGHRNDVDGDGDTYTVLTAETVHFTFSIFVPYIL